MPNIRQTIPQDAPNGPDTTLALAITLHCALGRAARANF